jgi:hypothetical protein
MASTIIELSGLNPIAAEIAWVASGEFCEPETVLPLPDGTLLVSNVCGFSESGSGFLTLLDGDGRVLDWRIVSGLDAPLGMTIQGDRLYVIDSNRVKILTWPAYELLQVLELETSVANDIAITPDQVIYVSDSAKHQVLQVLPDGSQSVLTADVSFQNANGIAYANDQLYVGGARLWRVDLRSLSRETLGPTWLADIDGIEFEEDGTIQLTPVGGPLVRLLPDQEIQIFTGEGISSANHGYSADLGLALIPTGYDNTVIAIRIPSQNTEEHQGQSKAPE